MQFRRGGIVSKVLVDLGDDLADQHALVESQPIDEHPLEKLVVRIGGVAGFFVLQARPRRFVGADFFIAGALVAEIRLDRNGLGRRAKRVLSDDSVDRYGVSDLAHFIALLLAVRCSRHP